ncbi:hypothetical protein KC906_04095 [Candidatus Kaiserbacteria bacterium]|nr:hypothetical protein [Candidatus Kaiserbacteria bacterium]
MKRNIDVFTWLTGTIVCILMVAAGFAIAAHTIERGDGSPSSTMTMKQWIIDICCTSS